MTLEDTKTVLKIMTENDCHQDMFDAFLKAFPDQLITVKFVWRECYGTEFEREQK